VDSSVSAPVTATDGSQPADAAPEGSLSLVPATAPSGNQTDPGPVQGPPKPEQIQISSALGAVTDLSEAHQMEFYACEAVLETASSNFVQAGLAFGRIRDCDLYLLGGKYKSFDTYCRERWQYSRAYVDRLIAAAQVFTQLLTNGQQKPEHERQVRPLIGLPPDQVRLAWEKAVSNAGGKKIREAMVKRAVKELQSEIPDAPTPPKRRHARMAAHRQMIDEAIGQLLLMVSQKANHDLLMRKVEALHGYFQALFPKPAKR